MKRNIPHLFVAALLAMMSSLSWSVPVVYASSLTPELGGATGTGFVTVTVDNDADTMRVEATFAGLSGTTTVAHIHCCTATPGTGVVTVASVPGTFPGFPAGASSGSYDMILNMSLASMFSGDFIAANGGSASSAFDALIQGMSDGKAYFNVHTSTFPAGEIRGFLALQRQAVPEPTTWVLVMGALVGFGASMRRRRG